MKLPIPQGQYSRTVEVDRNRLIEMADAMNHKRNRDVEIADTRLILTSPNGTRYSVTVDNAGVISTTAI